MSDQDIMHRPITHRHTLEAHMWRRDRMLIMATLLCIGEITGTTVTAVTTTIITIGDLNVASSAAIAGNS
jgi:hypothetical protein